MDGQPAKMDRKWPPGRLVKWLGALVAGLLGFALAASGTVLLIGERRLSAIHAAEPTPLRVTGGNVAEGGRLTKVFGCTACHGKDLAGEDFYGVQSANLVRIAKAYNPDAFAFAVRHGIRPDGTSLTWGMPSDFFTVMADDQIRNIHAYLVSLPDRPDGKVAGFLPSKHIGVGLGETLLAVDVVRPEAAPVLAPKPGEAAFGPYFARVGCAECHGFDLQGSADGAPPLAIVARAYDRAAFRTFLRTGRSVGGRDDLPMMSGVARWRLSHMTEAEVDALHDWLVSLPNPGE